MQDYVFTLILSEKADSQEEAEELFKQRLTDMTHGDIWENGTVELDALPE